MTEQLKKENEEIKARLAKAISIFKEQKATIEDLTSKNTSLKEQLKQSEDLLKERTSELENEVKSLIEKNKEYSEKNNEFFELLENIETLNSENTKLKSDLEETADGLHQQIIINGEQQEYLKSVIAEKEQLSNELSETKEKNSDLEKAIDTMETNFQTLKQTINSTFVQMKDVIERHTKDMNSEIHKVLNDANIA
jgi:chromosome segregation ATPase